VGIDLRLIESYAVQRGFDLLAVETAEEVVVGLKEDWKERKELVSMAGKCTSERGRRKTKDNRIMQSRELHKLRDRGIQRLT
jgi:hypothetical protein